MKIIEVDDAQGSLHEMWDALFDAGTMQFARAGRVVVTMKWTGSPEDREEVLQDLAQHQVRLR